MAAVKKRSPATQEGGPSAVVTEYPVRFCDLVGHRDKLELIERCLAKSALPQSIILSGPQSVGKATLARMMAAALQCESPTPSACGECLPCKKMRRGVHPDFRVVTIEEKEDGKPRKEIVIDQVRKGILEPLSLPPYEGNRLIFVIDPADAMNAPCQNILLKPLEEPPPYAQFILVTSSPWSLLPTIHSRCQRIGFAPIKEREMERWISERGGIGDERRALAMSWAAGRPGKLADFKPEAFVSRRKEILSLMGDGLDIKAGAQLLAITERLSKERPASLLDEFSVLLADIRRVEAGLQARVHRDASEELKEAALKRGSVGLDALAERIALAPAHLAYNVNPRLMIEWIFLTT